MNDRAVAIASYLYAFNTLCLTFRAFGHVMEQSKHVGTIQIALFSILSDIRIVFGQFVVAVLAFSFAIAKVYMAEQSYITNGSDAPDTNGSDAHDMWVDIKVHMQWKTNETTYLKVLSKLGRTVFSVL